MKTKLSILAIIILLSGCSSWWGGKKMQELKSPCVSTKEGPCGERYPINRGWGGILGRTV